MKDTIVRIKNAIVGAAKLKPYLAMLICWTALFTCTEIFFIINALTSFGFWFHTCFLTLQIGIGIWAILQLSAVAAELYFKE